VADTAKNLFVADRDNNVIRKMSTVTNIVTRFAGTGAFGYTGNGGQATSAKMYHPFGVWGDTANKIYITDRPNNVVRVVSVTGIISAFAGKYTYGGYLGTYSGDNGKATSADLGFPTMIWGDTLNSYIYITDYNNFRVRRVQLSTSIITTFAGTGVSGNTGNNVVATSATLKGPTGIFGDVKGNLYFTDYLADVIRKVVISTNIITTIGGTGVAAYNGDGLAALSTNLNGPYYIWADTSNNIYIPERDGNRVRVMLSSGNTVQTIAGNGTAGFSGDFGPATSAMIYRPHAVWGDNTGNLFFSDQTNRRIRELTMRTNAPTRKPTASAT